MLSGDVRQTEKLPRNHEPKERCEYPSAETMKLKSQRPDLCRRLVQAAKQKNI